MGTIGKPVQLKLFLDNQKKKVMFAEAELDFVEILFSFLTLPLGTIARRIRKQAFSKDIRVGSFTSLYESVMNLNENLFVNKGCKDALLNTLNSSAFVCQKLKVNIDDESKPIYFQHDGVFVIKKKINFIITDDLNVVPAMLDTSIALLESLGLEYNHSLDEKTMYFGLEEFSNLLLWSLVTNNPLTHMVFGGSTLSKCSSRITNSSPLNSSNSSQTQTLKLLVHKSSRKVICAEAENHFVELLFSFLTIPLGSYMNLTKDSSLTSSPVCISNLYNSISRLGDGEYLISDQDVKSMLLCPKLASNYYRVTDLLPIYEVNTHLGRFLYDHATYIISDDLEVTPAPSISKISRINTVGAAVTDLEVLKVSFGEQEALLLLKASLTSTSALTDFLDAFQKKSKDHEPNTAFVDDGGRDSGEEDDFTFVEENDIDESFVMVD